MSLHPRKLRLVAFVVLIGFFTATSIWAANRVKSDRPNVLFVLADDLGWSDLRCYGSDYHETPSLDQLSQQGVRFTSAYAAAPVCTPTRASIMTGKYPARLHMTVWYEASRNPPTNREMIPPITVGNLAHQHVTLAEAFKAAGYFTAHIGKWHLGDAAHYPETHGFDVNIGGTFWGAPSTFFYPYRGLWSRSTEFRYVPGLHDGQNGQYLTDRLTDEVIAVMRNPKHRPFFLHLAFHTVHTPIEGKPRLVKYYETKRKSHRRHQNPTYAAMVRSLDENVGRLLRELDESGLAENTIVVFTSDNGGYTNPYRGVTVTSNAPLRSGKGSLYEGGIRVPLIVRWPSVTEEAATRDEVILSTDFYPTLLEATGISGNAAYNGSVDGKSFAGLLRSATGRVESRDLFWHYPHYYPTTTPVSAIRSGRWKLLEFIEDGRTELYDLHEDLGETRDLAAENPTLATSLRTRLRQWRDQVRAQMPKRKAG